MSNILLIDNYDSFTYNLVHYLSELGANVEVVRNDAISIANLRENKPSGIVISPGPGEPRNSGICPQVIEQLSGEIPIFGVCLGHQAIGEVFGATVIRNHPMHGKTSLIHHNNEGIFAGIKNPFIATRYHSLVISPPTMPDSLIATAHTEDGTIMALQHKTHPTYGVQFHPESIASECGHDLLNNFLKIIREHNV